MKHSYQAFEHIMIEKGHILLVACITTGHLREKGTSPTASEWCAGGPPAKAKDIRDVGSIPGLGRSPGGGHGNPLQYSCLENPLNRRAWWLQSMGLQRADTTEAT